jgi:hypothetical protein
MTLMALKAKGTGRNEAAQEENQTSVLFNTWFNAGVHSKVSLHDP